MGDDDDEIFISIGPNETRIPIKIFEKIDWTFSSNATRTLLLEVFGHEVLATHTMTGKPSPAFKDKPAKNRLDPLKLEDIIFAITRQSGATVKEVRSLITAKCGYENRKMKQQEENTANGTLTTNHKRSRSHSPEIQENMEVD